MTHRIAVTARTPLRRPAEGATTNGHDPAGGVVDSNTGLSRRCLRTGRPPAPITRRRRPSPVSATKLPRSPRVPNVVDTLMRTMTIGSAMASTAVLERADLAIHPDTSSIGFLEWHQIDRAREAGRIATREALPRIIEVVGG